MSTKKLQIIGGNFGGNVIQIDDTLTQPGQAADAKATGNAINQMQISIDELTDLIGDSSVEHSHDDRYYTEDEIDNKLDAIQLAIDAKVDTTEISDLNDRIDGVEGSITTVNETLNDISQDIEDYKTTNNEAVSANTDDIEANRISIEAIQADYLTSIDKTQLQDEISQVSNQATVNASAIEILNGEGDGSIKRSIDDAFNEFAADVTNDDVVNTYKELIDYAKEHGSEFTELVGVVDNNAYRIETVELDLAQYKASVYDQVVRIDETIDGHIADTENPHGVTKEQIGLDAVDNTADVDKPISNDMQAALDEKSDLVHGHEIEDVNNLQDSLDELQGNIDTHVENKENPHEVTTEQIGAYTREEVDDKVESLSMLTYINSKGVLFIRVEDLTKITSSISSGNVTSKTLTSTYSNENVTISGFNSYTYANENIIII